MLRFVDSHTAPNASDHARLPKSERGSHSGACVRVRGWAHGVYNGAMSALLFLLPQLRRRMAHTTVDPGLEQI